MHYFQSIDYLYKEFYRIRWLYFLTHFVSQKEVYRYSEKFKVHNYLNAILIFKSIYPVSNREINRNEFVFIDLPYLQIQRV